jgi:hypothetical protein
VLDADEFGQPLLHLADFRAEDVLAMFQEDRQPPVQIATDEPLLRFQIDELQGQAPNDRVGRATRQ